MNPSDQTEQHYVHVLRDSTATSFSQLYDAYSPALYGVILRLVHEPVKAEDLLQETFLKVWLNRQQFDPQQGRLFTWLAAIARHVALDEIRSQKVRMRGQSYLYDRSESTVRPTVLTGKVNQPLLNQLTPNYQAVVELMYYKEYTSLEIAQTLKLPLGTVKTRIRKALQELRVHLKKDIDHYHAT